MNAVFVDSSSLSTGLANTQAQLCASLSMGGSLDNFAYNLGLGAVRSVAWELLCDPASASRVQLSDIPGMLDGSAAAGPLGTMRALRLLATVRHPGRRGTVALAGQHDSPCCRPVVLHHALAEHLLHTCRRWLQHACCRLPCCRAGAGCGSGPWALHFRLPPTILVP